MPFLFIFLLAGGLAISAWSGELSLFANPHLHSSYSPLLQEKNSHADSLLPALNGDQTFNELIRTNPKLWSIERLDKLGELVTQLDVEVIYVDGLREEQFCDLDKGRSSAETWVLRLGVDFISGGSNTVPIHVQQCLESIRGELGYKVRKGDKVVEIPARKVLDEIRKSKIPTVLDPSLQAQVLKAHNQVKVKGECPSDIEAYAILLDVWDQVKSTSVDLAILNDHLNPEENGGRRVRSCAFSREWNQRYSEDAALYCEEATMRCKYVQTEDGTTRWLLDPVTDAFVFQPLWGIFGGKTVHKGGSMLDLRILTLSSSLFLEAYLDEKGAPVSLGLITVPEK